MRIKIKRIILIALCLITLVMCVSCNGIAFGKKKAFKDLEPKIERYLNNNGYTECKIEYENFKLEKAEPNVVQKQYIDVGFGTGVYKMAIQVECKFEGEPVRASVQANIIKLSEKAAQGIEERYFIWGGGDIWIISVEKL